MPYITEEIWQSLPHEGDALVVNSYPSYDASLSFPAETGKMESVMAVVRAVRNRRSEMNVAPGRKAMLYIAAARKEAFEEGREIFLRMAYASGVEVGDSFDIPGAVTIVTPDAKIYIPMEELVDKEAELKRLTKELESAQKQLNTANAKQNNEKFMSKAPANVVEGVRQNAQKLEEHIALIRSSMEALQ